MPRHAKTHKRKHHSKTSRRSHRRMTHRRKTRRGGADCKDLRAEFDRLKESVKKITKNEVDNITSKLRHIHDKAKHDGCEELAKEINKYENKVFYPKVSNLYKQ
jgi:hypothetical protein